MSFAQRLLHLTVCAALFAPSGFCADEAVALPNGIKAVWDFAKAAKETTPTRERVCINGLWRWQPAQAEQNAPAPGEAAVAPPTSKWGYYKVPAPWPGAHGQESADTQRAYRHPGWAANNDQVCWYQREISIPASWKDRDVFVEINWLQSVANVYLGDKLVGNVKYPGGKVNVTAGAKPGETQMLSICVAAVPLSQDVTVFMKGDLKATGKATVTRRGLCGNVYLESAPAKARISQLKIDPSVRKWELSVKAGLANLAADKEYSFKGEILDGGKKVHSFEAKPFKAADVKDGSFTFVTPWKAEKLWDLNATGNVYTLKLSLVEGKTVVDDFLPTRVAFREFWTEGKDLRLNGTRLHLFAYPYNGAIMSSYNASYEGAKEAMLLLKDAGFTMLYAHNYSANPGDSLSYEDTMRAADDVGMVFAFTMAITDPAHTEYLVQQVAPHPSVAFYAISHNNYGFADDYNPAILHSHPDFTADPTNKEKRNDRKGNEAKAREALITRFDTSRSIYHHGGNPSDFAAPNMYLNFVPPQEVSEWFTTWSEKNKKPLFPAEFGNAVDADFTMFRGFETDANGVSIMPLEDPSLGRKGSMRKMGAYFYGSSLRHEYHMAGYGAQFRGDIAYQLTDKELTNLKYEASEWQKVGRPTGWKFYSYPINVNNPKFDTPNQRDIQAQYVEENYPAFRVLGLTAMNTWYYSELFQLKDNPTQGKPGVRKPAEDEGGAGYHRWLFPLTVDWDALQKPGYSPDWRNAPHKYQESSFPYSHSKEDWLEVGKLTKAWLKVTRPAFAYIAGKPAHVFGKDRNFFPGETAEKTIIVLNETRATVTADCEWTTSLPGAKPEKKQTKVETGEQGRIPIKFTVPADAKPGEYTITLNTTFSNGEKQVDTFAIAVMPKLAKPKLAQAVSLFDPAGKTKKVLTELGVTATDVKADAKIAKGVLVIGKNALSVEGQGPDLSGVRDGLKVVVFEQNVSALQYRLGLRTVEYGLRNLFPRFASHPLLADTTPQNWWNWRGKSGAEQSDLFFMYYTPSWKYCSEVITDWAGVWVNRAYRGSTYGSVASILIEKPHNGDFTPVLEGGFGLQYGPLMEYREGKGVVIFCQLDVSNRDETDPAAKILVRNILEYADKWQSTIPERKAFYVGDAAGKAHLEKTGIAADEYKGGAIAKDTVLIVGPGVGTGLAAHAADIATFVKGGGNILALGLTAPEANSFLPFQVAMTEMEHMATHFPIQDEKSLFAGINPAGVHSREPRKLQVLSADAAVDVLGNGILAKAKSGNVVFCQMLPWTFNLNERHDLKTCYRYSSELVNRVLGNMGVRGKNTLLSRFSKPGDMNTPPKEMYVDTPVEADDPYRAAGW